MHARGELRDDAPLLLVELGGQRGVLHDLVELALLASARRSELRGPHHVEERVVHRAVHEARREPVDVEAHVHPGARRVLRVEALAEDEHQRLALDPVHVALVLLLLRVRVRVRVRVKLRVRVRVRVSLANLTLTCAPPPATHAKTLSAFWTEGRFSARLAQCTRVMGAERKMLFSPST